jgi:hypothetical protein
VSVLTTVFLIVPTLMARSVIIGGVFAAGFVPRVCVLAERLRGYSGCDYDQTDHRER